MKLLLRKMTVLTVALLLAVPAWAAVDDMPPPRSAPRTKVAQQKLDQEAARSGRVLTGAVNITGDKIHIGDTDIRLYGVVVPQATSAHGAEARAALARLMNEANVSCHVLERDRNFRLLAQCKTARTDDVGMALLQQGWALVARSVVQGSVYADLYLAAENKAQVQKLGLWAPAEEKPAVPESKNDSAAATAASALPAAAAAVTPLPDVVKLDEKTPPPAATAAAAPTVAVVPALATAIPAPPKNEALPKQNSVIPNQAAPAVDSSAFDSSDQLPLLSQEQMTAWLWFAGLTPALIMILFAFGQIALRRYEFRHERRTLAAALRGELLAARAICATRAEALAYDAEMMTKKTAALWPRLRANVYAAHVGRIGLLGADLARKVATLYGQFSDYAQYYTPRNQADAPRGDAAGVQQSLFTLVDHIEETLNNLQTVEASGRAYKSSVAARRAAAAAPLRRSPAPVVRTEPAGQLEYVAVDEAEEQALPTRQAAKTDAKKKPQGDAEKIANATSAMMEMLIAEQDDGDGVTDGLMFEAQPAEKSSKADEAKAEGKAKKSGKSGAAQAALPLKADAAAGAPRAGKTDAKGEAKTAKIEKLEPKAEYYDFRSQASNIARG